MLSFFYPKPAPPLRITSHSPLRTTRHPLLWITSSTTLIEPLHILFFGPPYRTTFIAATSNHQLLKTLGIFTIKRPLNSRTLSTNYPTPRGSYSFRQKKHLPRYTSTLSASGRGVSNKNTILFGLLKIVSYLRGAKTALYARLRT